MESNVLTLMALAATEVNPVVTEPDLVVSKLLAGQENPINPGHYDVAASIMNTDIAHLPAAINENDTTQLPESDFDEEVIYIKINPSNNNSSSVDVDVSGVRYNDNKYDLRTQIAEERSPIQPKRLFAQTEDEYSNINTNPIVNQNYIPDSFYAQTYEERNALDRASGHYNSEHEPTRNQVNSSSPVNQQVKEYDFLDSQKHAGFRFKSPVDSTRYAWADNQPHLRNEGYNSDSDISRNKKFSLDGHKGNTSQFVKRMEKGHRRVKSGDAVGWQNYENNSVQPMFDLQQTPPKNFLHSQSSGCINVVTPEPNLPPFIQSASVDTHVHTDIHEHLCLQSTSFVALTNAISESARDMEHLKAEVDEKKNDLNDLNVKQSHTNIECRHLEEEIKHLMKEIQEMSNECDEMGIKVPGDPPNSTNFRYSTPPNKFAAYPISPNNHASPITAQPQSNYNKNSNYENVIDYKRKSDPSVLSDVSRVQTPPPPIPPRLPMIAMNPQNEHWICADCTFKNLLVHECEICQAPRPVKLR